MGVSAVSVSAALGAAFMGNSALLFAAAETASETGSTLAPWLQGGGSAAAVGGLVYVARLIVTGQLVPRPVREAEAELAAGILAAAQREDRVLTLAETAQRDHDMCRERADRTLVALTEMTAAMREVSEEMRYWREMRQRGGIRGGER